MKHSISIIIPAYNEELNIQDAIETSVCAVKKEADDYEIIVIDDGSEDKTGEIAESLAKKNKRIVVLHNLKNLGFGDSIRKGINRASKTYITGFPGDNDTSGDLLVRFLRQLEKADLLIAVMMNKEVRPFYRRFISESYVLLMNMLFGMHLSYYNGYFACKTKLLRDIPLYSKGFTIFAEAKVRLIKQGASFVEIPFDHIGRKHGKSKAMSWRNIIDTVRTTFLLLLDVYLK